MSFHKTKISGTHSRAQTHTHERKIDAILDVQALKTNTNYKSFVNNLQSDYNTRAENYCSRKYHNVNKTR